MSRELIAGADATEFIKPKDKMPALDVPAMKKFLEAKGLPPTTVDTLMPRIEDRLKRASSFDSKDIPRRILEWSMAQIRQELDGLVDKSPALVGTSLALTAQSGREEGARRVQEQTDAERQREIDKRKAAEEAARAAEQAQRDAQGNRLFAALRGR